MHITSPAFENNGKIPQKYSCEGEGIHPPLRIEQVPQNAKSLVLIVDDPDAPMGTFIHWVVFNIPPTTTEIPEDKIPQGAISASDWVAPCPPSGMHHYRFFLWALSESLTLSSSATKEEVEKTAQKYLIEKSELLGTYQKTSL